MNTHVHTDFDCLTYQAVLWVDRWQDSWLYFYNLWRVIKDV